MSKEEMKNFADECKKSGDLLKLENVNKTELKVSKGNSVTVEYIGKLNNGEIFDNGTITFIAGAGQMIPGFDEGIMGMKINESKLIVVPPKKGYGTIDQLTPIPKEISQDIPLATFKQIFKEEPSLNKEYNISNNPWPLKVIKINTKKYNCTVKILNISTKEEYANRSCLKAYGLTDGTVAFYHASWCPHCQKMEPWVKELENQGYKFLWAQADSQESTMVANVKIAQECYKDVINFGGGIPQFGCAANGQLHIGEFMSKEEMKNFAEKCKQDALYPSRDNNTIKNCTIKNFYIGIVFDSTLNNTIMNNTITENTVGILLHYSSNNNLITNNTANNNYNGIYLYNNSNLNKILSNKILNNIEKGILMSNCNPWGWCANGNSNNTIEDNEILNNKIGIFSTSSNSIINRNVVCGNTQLDFNSSDWLSSYGSNNTCDKSDGWNDTEKGTTGCTYSCCVSYDLDNNHVIDIFDAVTGLEYLSGERNESEIFNKECSKGIDGKFDFIDLLTLISKIGTDEI